MADQRQDRHVDLDTLADFIADELAPTQRDAVQQHLALCPFCSLEVKRLARFAVMDQDEDLLAEAHWDEARFALERSYRDQVKSFVQGQAEAAAEASAATSHLRWLVPVAAAAVLAVALLSGGPKLLTSEDGRSGDAETQILRGGAAQANVIVPRSPVGEVDEPPALFWWDTQRAFDSYTLEVATVNLDNVFRQTGIVNTHFALSDSLRALLLPGRGYLWNVKGHDGLTAAVISETFWFEVTQ